jgi:hypothetical protein
MFSSYSSSFAATVPSPGVVTPGSGIVVAPSGLELSVGIPSGMEGWDHTFAPDGLGLGLLLGTPLGLGTSPIDPFPPADDPTFTAQSVLEAARDKHSSFDKQRHPDPILLRFLDRYQRQLLAKAIERNGSFAAATVELALPAAADFAGGIRLGFAYHLIHGGEVGFLTGGQQEFTLVPYGQRYMAPGLSGWIHGNRLHLAGAASDWTGVTGITLSYVPTVSRLSNLRSVLQLPRSSEAAMVEAVSAFMAGRGHNDPQLPPINVAGYVSVAALAEQDFLQEIGNRRRSQLKRIREVFW